MTPINFNPQPSTANSTQTTGRGFDSLGQADFIRLMTVQMQQQDPFAPVDNTEMLAQMAQFSSLSSTTEMGDTLKEMSSKLDQLIAAQNSANAEAKSTGDASGPVAADYPIFPVAADYPIFPNA